MSEAAPNITASLDLATLNQQVNPTASASTAAAVERMQESMMACRITFNWLGEKKGLTDEQKDQAASTFNAVGERISAAKKIINTKDRAYRNVTKIRSRAKDYWRGLTLPYPEPGIRLIKRSDVEAFNQAMEGFRTELNQSVEHLETDYTRLKQDAHDTLGELFREEDYPTTLIGLFCVEWDFPSISPDESLQHISPAIYERERQKAQSRLQQAVDMAETDFMQKMADLVTHLSEKITGENKTFRDSAVTNLTEFFEQFKHLNVSSNRDFDALIDRAQRVVQGVAPQDLRENKSIRETVAQQIKAVKDTLDGMLVERPRRTIIRNRPPQQSAPSSAGPTSNPESATPEAPVPAEAA